MFTNLSCLCHVVREQSIYSPLFGFWLLLLDYEHFLCAACHRTECLFCQLRRIDCSFNQLFVFSTSVLPFSCPCFNFSPVTFPLLYPALCSCCPNVSQTCLARTHIPHPSPSTTGPWLLPGLVSCEYWMTDRLTPDRCVGYRETSWMCVHVWQREWEMIHGVSMWSLLTVLLGKREKEMNSGPLLLNELLLSRYSCW